MSPLTAIVVAAMLYGLIGRRGYTVALALGGITASGAAFASGRFVVPTFYAVALGAAAGLVLSFVFRRGGGHSLPPGVSLLVAFGGYTIVLTLLSPLMFNGLPSITPNPGRLTAGVLTSSNVAQIIYLVIGIGVVAFIARDPRAQPGIVGITTVGATALCFWRYLAITFGVPFPEGLFDNSPVFAYIETAPGDVPRFRGIFSEPAGVAGSSLVTVAWTLSSLGGRSAWQRTWRLLTAATAIFLGSISTSTTFVVAGVICLAFASAVLIWQFLLRRLRVSTLAATVALGASAVLIFASPPIIDFVQNSINAKVGTASYDNRSSVNGLLYDAFSDTLGLGAGLGSGRASSFVATLVGTTGFVGVALFVAAVAQLTTRGTRLPEYRPVAWTLAVLLITKAVSGPDLSDSTGLLWICFGLLSHSVLLQRGTALNTSRHVGTKFSVAQRE